MKTRPGIVQSASKIGRGALAALVTAGLFTGAAAVPALACGPSFQAVYEGDARFEHCYFLDDSPEIPLEKKGDCWRDWSLHYTYGQTRNRVEYAASRFRALSRVPSLPTDESMMEAAPGEGANANAALPAPTSAFAPPPGTMLADAGGDGGHAAGSPADDKKVVPVGPARAAGEGADAPPGTACADACQKAWRSCADGCQGKKCDVCDRDYRRCGRGCLRDDAPKKNGAAPR